MNLATALAINGQRVLLIDADTWQPSLVPALNIQEHPPGLSALCRAVRNQTITSHELQRQCVQVEFAKHRFALLPGLANPERWPEITPGAMQVILELALATFDAVLIDCPPRFGAELQRKDSPLARDSLLDWLLTNAETNYFVASADPVSIARLVAANPDKCEIVINRYRATTIGLAAKSQISQTLATLLKKKVKAFLPLDQKACDQATHLGAPLASVRRNSPLKAAIGKLARDQKLSG